MNKGFPAAGTALAMLRSDKTSLSRFETGRVMRLGESRKAGRKAGKRPADGFAPPAAEETPATAPESRALVATTPACSREPPSVYRQTPFLAQLIATRDQLPQMRERRRAEPGESIAAYQAAAILVP